MEDNETFVIVFHGTTSAFDDSIQENGFVPKPTKRPSEQAEDGHIHMAAFDGTYVALEKNTATYYAKQAAEVFGGEPRIYAMRVPLSSMVPDEDEVHFALSCHLAAALGFDESSIEEFQYATQSWSPDVAKDAVQGIAECFGMDEAAVELAAGHLHAMIEPTVQDWDGELFFFHPEGNDQGWASPHWVRKLASLEGGFDLYRDQMDKFLGCMRGASPETCPAGYDAFKGRITETFKLDDNANGVTVIGFGTLDDPFEHFRNLTSLNGAEMVLVPEMLEAAKTTTLRI